MMNAAGFPPGYAAYAYYGGSVLPANYQYGTPTAMYPVSLLDCLIFVTAGHILRGSCGLFGQF